MTREERKGITSFNDLVRRARERGALVGTVESVTIKSINMRRKDDPIKFGPKNPDDDGLGDDD